MTNVGSADIDLLARFKIFFIELLLRASSCGDEFFNRLIRKLSFVFNDLSEACVIYFFILFSIYEKRKFTLNEPYLLAEKRPSLIRLCFFIPFILLLFIFI